MSAGWQEALDQVFAAIRIDAPHELTFAGRKLTVPPSPVPAVPGVNGNGNVNNVNGNGAKVPPAAGPYICSESRSATKWNFQPYRRATSSAPGLRSVGLLGGWPSRGMMP